MPQQQLDRAQVRARLQQMRRIAVPQRVRADPPGDPRAFGRSLNDALRRARFHRPIRAVVLRKQPDLGPPRPPVIAQHPQQLRRQLHHPVLVPLAQPHMNQHPRTVNVRRLQCQRFGDTQPRGVQCHQQRLVLEIMFHHIKQSPQFIARKHRRQPLGSPGAGQLLKLHILPQRDLVEKLQPATRDVVPAPAHTLVPHQMQQILPHLIGIQLLG